MTSAETALYVYCVVRAEDLPVTGAAPAGLPEASPPRVLEIGAGERTGLWAIVADAPLALYGAEEIDRRLSDLAWVSACALAHEGMVEHFAAQTAVLAALPMKLFTLFSSEARAAEDLAARRGEIERVLDRVAGHVEWGLRVRFDADRARRPAEVAPPPASGTDFLLRKKREREGAKTLASGAAQAVERTFQVLSGRAREARRRDLAGANQAGLLLDAAFLVPGAEAEAFEGAVGAEAERLAECACEVTLTGPWPPYNFIEELR